MSLLMQAHRLQMQVREACQRGELLANSFKVSESLSFILFEVCLQVLAAFSDASSKPGVRVEVALGCDITSRELTPRRAEW